MASKFVLLGFFIFGNYAVSSSQDTKTRILYTWQEEFQLEPTQWEKTAQNYLTSYLKNKSPSLLETTPFRLSKVRKSLLARHFSFQQTFQGKDLERSEIIISLFEKDGKLFRIFDHAALDFKLRERPLAWKISAEQALDIAWSDLRVHEPLMEKPSVRQSIQLIGSELQPIYITMIAVEAPFGYWRHTISGVRGKIMERTDTRVVRHGVSDDQSISSYYGPILNRLKETKRYFKAHRHQLDRESLEAEATAATGHGKIFDPDPRTFLGRADLSDSSPDEWFDDAYLMRDISDITFDEGVYRLKGPWVSLEDFETPNTSPVTSTDAQWLFKRGESGFNDVMTYFHLNQSQRYIQSLGFTGEMGIQARPIAVDSDGLDGADNSHYIPGINKLSFGRGCVDDNEDADVILHEYGHAINFDINPNWDGGDADAMGEGFGDYWAQSYSLSTPKGKLFDFQRVFQWDAASDCWPGRRLNVLGARYDDARNYYAHTEISDDGVISDELWSTPLYQALLEILERGGVHREVDRIILESHFGLGADLKMRQMAESIVRTAQTLHPDGPYAAVFVKKFTHHNILESTEPALPTPPSGMDPVSTEFPEPPMDELGRL